VVATRGPQVAYVHRVVDATDLNAIIILWIWAQ
jgi:hypothetical protein